MGYSSKGIETLNFSIPRSGRGGLSWRTAFCVLLLVWGVFSCGGRDRYARRSLEPFFPRGGTWFSTLSGELIPGTNEAGERGIDLASLEVHDEWLSIASERRGLNVVHNRFRKIKLQSDPELGGCLSDPLYDSGKIFAVFKKGYLVAFDLKNGSELWRYEVSSPIVSKPSVYQGRLFFSTPDDVTVALDAETGKLLWNYRRKGSSGNSTARVATPTLIQGTLWIGSTDGSVVGLQVENGDVVFERRLSKGGKFTDLDSTPLFIDGIVYVQTFDGSLFALKASDRSVVWSIEDGGSRAITKSEESGGIFLYASSNSGKVRKLNPKTGQVIWSFDLDGGTPTEAITWGQEVIVGSSHRYLYSLDSSTGSLKRRYDFGSGSGVLAKPETSTDKKRLFVMSSAGNLYDFKAL